MPRSATPPGQVAVGAGFALIATAVADRTPLQVRAALLAAGSFSAVALLLPRRDLGDPAVRYAESPIADLGLAVAFVLLAGLLARGGPGATLTSVELSNPEGARGCHAMFRRMLAAARTSVRRRCRAGPGH